MLLIYFLLVFIIDYITASLGFIGVGRLIMAIVALILFYKLNSVLAMTIIVSDLFFGFAERAKELLKKE